MLRWLDNGKEKILQRWSEARLEWVDVPVVEEKGGDTKK